MFREQFRHIDYTFTLGYLFCRFVRSLALMGHQGLGHIGVSKWREELQQTDKPFYHKNFTMLFFHVMATYTSLTLVTLT